MAEEKDYAGKIVVKALISGVFYRGPAPEEPPYVEVGDVVEKKQTLCLIESMKVFNKIRSPARGKVVEIVAENEKIVDTDEIIMVIQPL